MEIKPGFGAVIGLAVVAVVGVALWRVSRIDVAGSIGRALDDAKRAAGEALEAAADAVNPMSANNVAYRGTNMALTAYAGEPTYASDILFSLLNPGARAAEQEMLNPAPQLTVWDVEDAEAGLAYRAATVTPGGAYIGYGAAFGRPRK